MKIKRYIAASMRLALAEVRQEQGPEAVILSSRRTEEGIEVIAAVDYDETLIADTGRRREAAAAPTPVVAEPVAPKPAAAAVRPVREAARPVVVPPPPGADPSYQDMWRELQDMRRLLEGGLANLAWSGTRAAEPLKARVLEELTALDITPDVAMKIAASTPRDTRFADPARIPLALLAKSLPLIEDTTCLRGGVAAVVGPTGVGKTTTIAKLAARWCVSNAADDLALVSTDGFRIGAREQLRTYARILGVPMHAADGAADLARVLERLRGKKLVLIDTAGFGPRDPGLAEQLEVLKTGAAHARYFLALPAQGEAHALREAATAFAGLAPAACILTKIDEAASLGAALSTAVRHGLPIAYLCNGQRVPEDLHAAHRRRIWLVKVASCLKQNVSPHRDENSLARHFGGVQHHA